MAPTPIGRTEEAAISLLTHHLHDTGFFRNSVDYMALLDFTAKMRNFAPSMPCSSTSKNPVFNTPPHNMTGEIGSTAPSRTEPALSLSCGPSVPWRSSSMWRTPQ